MAVDVKCFDIFQNSEMKILIEPFLSSSKYSVELVDFSPPRVMQDFLKNLCDFLDADFIDWQQSVESGIGHMTYSGYFLIVFWTDFPLSLSFDCPDKPTATQLQSDIEAYFRVNPLRESRS